jgi:hypothetical protein
VEAEWQMSDDRPQRDSMSIEEATISNMWEIAAIVEALERKGLCTKQDLHDIITEFRCKNPRAKIPETAFPEPYLLTETENKIIDDILELLNNQGLTSDQSMNLLERWAGSLRWGSGLRRGRRIRRYESLITAELVTLRGAAKQILVCMARPFDYHGT